VIDCKEEIITICWADMSDSIRDEFLYWSQIGAEGYYNLLLFASASTKRVWSIFSFIHSKSLKMGKFLEAGFYIDEQ
jgi:hypothetical protein